MKTPQVTYNIYKAMVSNSYSLYCNGSLVGCFNNYNEATQWIETATIIDCCIN